MSKNAQDSDVRGDAAKRPLFRPLESGRIRIRNRLMAPPHASVINDMFGSEADGEASLGYWRARAESGIGWIDGITGIIDSIVPVGFDPSGIGARVEGFFRRPVFHERVKRYADVLHANGVFATGQLVHQGGMPHGASPIQSSLINHQMPHVLTDSEIDWFVREYTFSACAYDGAGLDGVELHANNDDILEWFMSPRTNHRTDRYGGSLENRLRFLIQIVEAIRVNASPTFAIGLRITMDERIAGGYDIEEAVAMAKVMEDHGIDYVHGVVGSPWGNPGYIPPNHWPEGAFASLAGQIKEAVKIPVVYAGRVTTPAVAEAILEAGQADVIGVARALLSDAEFVSKAREGRDDEIRRCIGCNECIHRVQAEAIVFSCSVNPGAGREHLGPAVPTSWHGRSLVVGGGPAGLAFAVRAAELGIDVSLWERNGQLGGQMLIAARGPGQAELLSYVDYQSRRLSELGVDVKLAHTATADEILRTRFEAVVVATGSTSRRPPINGLDEAASVHDVRRVLMGEHVDGDSVVVVSQDDHLAPLSVAEVLAVSGKKVHIICQTNGPSPLLGRHTLGTVLARLSHLGITWTFMEQVVGVMAGFVHTKNVYSGQPGTPIPFDSLILACGSESDSSLADLLCGEVERLHVIGDAFAPRRISFATKQGYLLAERLAMETSSGIAGSTGGRLASGRTS